jgi:hypothetical protein
LAKTQVVQIFQACCVGYLFWEPGASAAIGQWLRRTLVRPYRYWANSTTLKISHLQHFGQPFIPLLRYIAMIA